MDERISYVSGKIEVQNGRCVVNGQPVDCPSRTLFGLGGTTQSGVKLDLLPSNLIVDTRNDLLFYGLLVAVIIIFSGLSVFKVKIFGKTLREYCRPIWILIMVCLLAVAWQYLVGIKLESHLGLRISQWIWQLAIAISAYILIRRYQDFHFGNLVFLAVFFSFLIHGTKVTIRYIFYDQTMLYILDRFLYGSFLVAVIVLGLGTVFLLTRKSNGPASRV